MKKFFIIVLLLFVQFTGYTQHKKIDSLDKAVKEAKNDSSLSILYLEKSRLYYKNNDQDSAVLYAKKAFGIARAGKYSHLTLNAGAVLSGYYEEYGNLPAAYKYLKLITTYKDSLFGVKSDSKLMLPSDFSEKRHQHDLFFAKMHYQEMIRNYIIITVGVVLLLLVIIFWRSSRRRKLDNELLSKQKEDTEKALNQLQITQNQLIQSEKMASLGELTAGIAHEIQNPLNFINNFSEVNTELLEEMQNELISGDKDEALSIVIDIKQNLEKIRHHGQRADGIVKGMLQHSRASSNVMEPTDINALADEYLRLAYHGLRAKDKSFNTELVTRFSDKLPLISVIPQDIGRVLLNMFTNAFYAVQQKQKQTKTNYKPEVVLTTKKENGNILIKVTDNGIGIPDEIKEKIMQPFFTTKPTGEGTGLGLSLSYDIVVKRHQGNIELDSKEGEFTTFLISLPVKQ